MVDKPRGRVLAGSSLTPTADSFVNFEAKLGLGAANQLSQGRYQQNFLSQNRTQLDAMYRGSWIVGQAVDIPAEDMTRAGVELTGPKLKPEDTEKLQAAAMDLMIGNRMAEAIKWGRLYGGAIAVPMIDGQKWHTPLKLDSIGEDQFKGLMVIDRWTCTPSTQLVTTLGPGFALPEFYNVIAGQGFPEMRIHHTRALRFTGVDLPFWQRPSVQWWGGSVMERILDRMVAYDSATMGVAQLVFKAHLRTIKIDGLRQVIATGGPLLEAVVRNMEMIRRFQSSEGMTVLDLKDEFQTDSYTFSGLDDVLMQLGQQLSGALEIPLVRLFGQSPAGLNSTGESDLRNYYDNIAKKQETALRRPWTVVMDILSRSVLGRPAGETFGFKFAPLWSMTPTERADAGLKRTQAVVGASELVSPKTSLQELRAGADVTGLWASISDQEINAAADEPPPPPETANVDPETGSGEGDTPNPSRDSPKPKGEPK